MFNLKSICIISGVVLLISGCAIIGIDKNKIPLISPSASQEKSEKLSIDSEALSAYARGNYLLEGGDLAGAEEAFKQALSAEPNSPKIKAKLAEVYFLQNRIKDAKKLAEDVSDDFKDDPNFLLLLGKIEATAGNMDMARNLLSRAAELAPDNDEILMLLWRLEADAGNFDAALGVLNRLKLKYPGVPDLYYWSGLVFELAGKPSDAVKEFEAALQIDPNFVPSMLKLGYLSLKNKDVETAEKYFRRVLDLDPGSIEALQGMAAIKGKDFTGPLPGSVEDLDLNVAIDLMDKGEYEQAINELKKAQENHPDNMMVYFFMGLAYEGMDNTAEAIESYRKIPPESALFPHARLRYAFCLARLKKTDEALRIAETLALDHPEIPEVMVLLGSLYIETEQPEKAVEILEPASGLNPKSEPILMTLAAAFYEAGRVEDSLKTMQRVLDINPENAEAMNFIGYSYVEKGERLDEAYSLIQKAMKLKPGSPEITDSLGWLFYQKGEYEKALIILEQAHALNPEEPVIAEHVGDALLKVGKKDKAVEMYRKALGSNPKQKQVIRLKEKIDSIGK